MTKILEFPPMIWLRNNLRHGEINSKDEIKTIKNKAYK
jgi:hypothetical protein